MNTFRTQKISAVTLLILEFKRSNLAGMDYTSSTIILNEKTIFGINSCKELAHHSKSKYSILCPRRLQPPRDDCAVRVQMVL